MKNRTVALAICIALALVLVGVLFAVLRMRGPHVSWSPISELPDRVVRVSASGKYIGVYGPIYSSEEGRLLIYRVADGKASPTPVLDSWRIKRYVWGFGWAGDALVWITTVGGPFASDLARKYAPDHDGNPEAGDVVARKYAKCFQRDMETRREKVVFRVRGEADMRADPETGDRPNGRMVVRNYYYRQKRDLRPAPLTFMDLKDGTVLSGVWGDAGLGDILCWNKRRDGIIVVYGDRTERHPGEHSEEMHIPCVLANISAAGRVTVIARVDVDVRSSESVSGYHFQASRSFACVNTAGSGSVAYFTKPSDPAAAIEVRFVPLDGGKLHTLTVKRRSIPMDDKPVLPIAIMPNGSGVLAQIGEDRLYYCAFDGKCVAVPVEMRREGVYTVFGPVGGNGVAIAVHAKAAQGAGEIGGYSGAGIVSVH